MKDECCEIRVEIPKDAKLQDVESAVEAALKTKLTDATLKDCKEITIILGRHPGT